MLSEMNHWAQVLNLDISYRPHVTQHVRAAPTGKLARSSSRGKWGVKEALAEADREPRRNREIAFHVYEKGQLTGVISETVLFFGFPMLQY